MASSSSFILKSTGAAAALGLDRICRPGLRKALEIASRLVFILALSLFLFGFLTETFSLWQLSFFLGFSAHSFWNGQKAPHLKFSGRLKKPGFLRSVKSCPRFLRMYYVSFFWNRILLSVLFFFGCCWIKRAWFLNCAMP